MIRVSLGDMCFYDTSFELKSIKASKDDLIIRGLIIDENGVKEKLMRFQLSRIHDLYVTIPDFSDGL